MCSSLQGQTTSFFLPDFAVEHIYSSLQTIEVQGAEFNIYLCKLTTANNNTKNIQILIVMLNSMYEQSFIRISIYIYTYIWSFPNLPKSFP